MSESRIRICDIADELGLSTATVSNVIHGKTHKVSDETVRRVQAKLEQRQYIPSMAGILLAQNASRIIGVVINDHKKYAGQTLADPFIADALNHLSEQIEAAGQFMMVKKTSDPRQIIPFASMWNLDGLVLLGFCNADYTWLREHMRVPFVVYDGGCEEPKRICNITTDNYGGGRLAGTHFLAAGHQHVLCIADNNTFVDKARWEGFRDAFGPGAEFWCVPMDTAQRHGFYRQHLPQLRQFTAVFAVSDHYAIDLMHVLLEEGFHIPQDMAVVGFDDSSVCTQVWPALSSVRQDTALRAKIAMDQLKALREDPDSASTVTVPVELIIRSSSAPA